MLGGWALHSVRNRKHVTVTMRPTLRRGKERMQAIPRKQTARPNGSMIMLKQVLHVLATVAAAVSMAKPSAHSQRVRQGRVMAFLLPVLLKYPMLVQYSTCRLVLQISSATTGHCRCSIRQRSVSQSPSLAVWL